MFKKIKNASFYLFPFGIILYFFGFLTITSLLARFGIVNFEIINARYIIAGIFSLGSICMVVYSAWYFSKKLPFNSFFKSDNWNERIYLYWAFIIEAYFISAVLTGLFNLGRYKPPTLIREYKPIFGKYDFIGNWIVKINFPKISHSIDNIFRDYLNIILYLIILLSLAFLVIYLISKIVKEIKKHWLIKKKITMKRVSKSRKKIVKKGKISVIIIAFEIISISTILILYFETIIMYGEKLFDFRTFFQTELTTGLFFMWFFNSVISIYIFLNTFKIPEINNFLKISKTMDISKNLPRIIQLGIIPILGSAILFGQLVYPRIPFMIGGGQPQEIFLETEEPMSNMLGGDGRYFLIGETMDFLYVVKIKDNEESKAFQINKKDVNSFITRKEKN